MLTFYIENHEPFDKSAVSTIQKANYVRCFNFHLSMFVFVHLFPDISIKSSKLHFWSWKKIVFYDFALLL